MRKTRTFIAVEAVGEVHGLAMAAIDRLTPDAAGVRWVEPDNLHWTLQFLGDIDDAEIHEVCKRTARAAAGHELFSLEAHGIGAFPSNDRPRTLWIGAGEGGEELVALHASIDAEMASLGFRGERRSFVPHLTLGRLARGSRHEPDLAERLASMTDYTGGVMPVDEVIVYASFLEKRGPTYQVLARCPLLG
jgi:RNA 2',3'-cyclic 3'-phosphodiesterase